MTGATVHWDRRRWLRPAITAAGLVVIWQVVVLATGVPPYILPAPLGVARALFDNAGLIAANGAVTVGEMLLGLVLGTAVGAGTALAMTASRPARRWMMPVLVASQAVPVFALAPILVLWLGYGLASKVAMATLVIYFPVTASFFDGLRRTEPGWLDLARTMDASRWAVLWRIRLPAALPAFGSGLRVAAAVAPIGAIIGEWVGASSGLGYQLLYANARMQTDLMFACLIALIAVAVGLYAAVDRGLRLALPWVPDSAGDDLHDQSERS